MRAIVTKTNITIYTIYGPISLKRIDKNTLEFISPYRGKTVYSSKGFLDALELVDFLIMPINNIGAKTYSDFETKYYNSLEDTVKIKLKDVS